MSTPHNNFTDEIMCACSGTTRSQIQTMFESGFTLDEISRKSGALSGCGGCEWDIEVFIKALSQQENYNGSKK